MASSRQVLDEERFWLLAEAAPVEQQQIAEQPVDDERDRRHEPARVVGGQGVARVGRDRRGGHDREQLVDERDAVPGQRRPRAHALEPQLGAALAERDEQREQERAEKQPVRDPDVDGDRAGCRPQHEEPCDGQDVDELDGLQSERVRGLETGERNEAEKRERPQGGCERERQKDERSGERERRAPRELSAGDGAVSLDGMLPIGCDVAHVVDEVRSARGRAVGDERGHGGGPPTGVAELRREDDSREQQEILRPLPWSHRDERRDGRRPPPGKLED